VPTPVDMSKVQRQILADKPRVTRFPIQWGGETSAADGAAATEDNQVSVQMFVLLSIYRALQFTARFVYKFHFNLRRR
jgi:hypothetical protein